MRRELGYSVYGRMRVRYERRVTPPRSPRITIRLISGTGIDNQGFEGTHRDLGSSRIMIEYYVGLTTSSSAGTRTAGIQPKSQTQRTPPRLGGLASYSRSGCPSYGACGVPSAPCDPPRLVSLVRLVHSTRGGLGLGFQISRVLCAKWTSAIRG